jgi:LuxR family maltose regulon positive regulatory protein
LYGKQDSEQLHEFEALSYAKVLIDAGDYDRAELFLEQLLLTAESRDRYGTKLEIMVLQAVVFHKTRRFQKGLKVIRKTVELGEKEDFVRTFLDEGEPIFDLLRRLRSDSPYVENLLACFREELESSVSDLVLTKREQDVLRLMENGMTNKEIAVSINVTVGTVKGYASVLFKKLVVHNRTQAVARARELNIL